MKCENCDLKCDNNNYCKIDGHYINEYGNDKIKIVHENICNDCGEINKAGNIYCNRCGNKLSILKQVEKNKYNIKDLYEKGNTIGNIKSYINRIDLKKKAIPAIVSMLLLIIIAIFIKLLISIMGLSINKYINIFSIVLGLNLVPINLVSSSVIGVGNVDISLGLIIYLVIPFICIGVSNVILIKKDYIKENEIFKDVFTISIIYGLLLGFISFLGKEFINVNVNEYYSMSIVIKYSFLNSVINGIIISVLPTYIVLFNKTKPKLKKFKVINRVLKTIGLIYLSILVILAMSLIFNNTYGGNDSISKFVNITQVGAYILQAVNLIPIVVLNTIISIFNISDISIYLNENLNLLIYSMILLTIIILIMTGYDIKNKFKDKKVIKYFCMYYSIIIGSIVYLSKIDTSGSLSLLELQNYETYSYIGSSVIVGIIIAFLYRYIVILLGYKLNNE